MWLWMVALNYNNQPLTRYGCSVASTLPSERQTGSQNRLANINRQCNWFSLGTYIFRSKSLDFQNQVLFWDYLIHNNLIWRMIYLLHDLNSWYVFSYVFVSDTVSTVYLTDIRLHLLVIKIKQSRPSLLPFLSGSSSTVKIFL